MQDAGEVCFGGCFADASRWQIWGAGRAAGGQVEDSVFAWGEVGDCGGRGGGGWLVGELFDDGAGDGGGGLGVAGGDDADGGGDLFGRACRYWALGRAALLPAGMPASLTGGGAGR